MFVQLFRSYFSEEIFSWSLSEWLSAQVDVFPKAKTCKHKGEIKTHQWIKNWKAKKSKQEKQKTNMHIRCIWKLHATNPLGNWKVEKKNLFDGKSVLLMVPWVRVDSDLFISLLFHLTFSWRYCVFENKCWTKRKEKEMKGTSLTTSVLWFSWCAHLRSWLHLLKTKLVRNQTERKPIPKPTLTFKHIRILREVMLPM